MRSPCWPVRAVLLRVPRAAVGSVRESGNRCSHPTPPAGALPPYGPYRDPRHHSAFPCQLVRLKVYLSPSDLKLTFAASQALQVSGNVASGCQVKDRNEVNSSVPQALSRWGDLAADSSPAAKEDGMDLQLRNHESEFGFGSTE